MKPYTIPSTDTKFMFDYRNDYDFHYSINKYWGKPAFPPTGDEIFSMSPKTQHLISKSYRLGPMKCDRKKIISNRVFETVGSLQQEQKRVGCCAPYKHGDMGSMISNQENEVCGYAFEGEPVVNTDTIPKYSWYGDKPKLLIDANQAQIYMKSKGMTDTNSLIDMSKYLKITNQMSLEYSEIVNQNIEMDKKIDLLTNSNKFTELESAKKEQALYQQDLVDMRNIIYQTVIEFILRQKYSPDFSAMLSIVFANKFLYEFRDEFLKKWSSLKDTDSRFKTIRFVNPNELIQKEDNEHQFFGTNKRRMSRRTNTRRTNTRRTNTRRINTRRINIRRTPNRRRTNTRTKSRIGRKKK